MDVCLYTAYIIMYPSMMSPMMPREQLKKRHNVALGQSGIKGNDVLSLNKSTKTATFITSSYYIVLYGLLSSRPKRR